MTMQRDEDPAAIVVEGIRVQPDRPEPPLGLNSEEARELEGKAAEAVAQLRDASGSKEMALIDSITTVGIRSQRQAGSDLQLLRGRVGDLIGKHGLGAGDRIAGELAELRATLNRIDPKKVGEESIVRRFVHVLPFGRRQILRTLETIAVRYEPISRQVMLLETRLREGRFLLTRDNIELRKLYEQVEGQQAAVQKNCYLGELLLRDLEDLQRETPDEPKRDRVQNAIFDVATRLQDMKTMEEVHKQLFVSLEMTRQNNTRLGQAIDRSLTLVTNVVMVGLAIQAALARQARVLEATRRTREFLGDLLVANATTIKQHTIEIGDVYKSPVIAFERIEQAHAELLEAISIADRLRDEGITAAKEHIEKLVKLADGIDARTLALPPGQEASIEA
jgi:uncharacterized protein YaaN involved in tellurite resistance